MTDGVKGRGANFAAISSKSRRPVAAGLPSQRASNKCPVQLHFREILSDAAELLDKRTVRFYSLRDKLRQLVVLMLFFYYYRFVPMIGIAGRNNCLVFASCVASNISR